MRTGNIKKVLFKPFLFILFLIPLYSVFIGAAEVVLARITVNVMISNILLMILNHYKEVLQHILIIVMDAIL